ncbi:MAG: hypothetical protein M1813_003785 [Trichoglossum hirsutum]|nr:MAG: hypothetical protein M1813_003785 [Trichoglossum hirsutum]
MPAHLITLPIAISAHDLSATDASQLASALSRPPRPGGGDGDEDWRETEARVVRALPRRLKAPVPFQERVVGGMARRGVAVPGCAPLCATHTPLNAQLIRSITALLAREAQRRPASAYSAPLVRAMGEEEEGGEEPRTCEACALARVGGDAEAVGVLRGLLAGRRRRRRRSGGREPRLRRLVEAWAGGFETEQERRRLAWWSGEVERWVRDSCRRGRRASDKPASPSDTESAILSYYYCAAVPDRRPSSYSFFRRPELDGHVHPAQRSSAAAVAADAEEVAADYRAVIGESPLRAGGCGSSSSPSSPSPSSSVGGRSAATTWGDFCGR